MNKEFIPYEQALELKNLGFDKEYLAHTPLMELHKTDYNVFGELKDIRIGLPLYQQAFRWFREKHNLFSFVTNIESIDYIGFKFTFSLEGLNFDILPVYDTYEEAELACLKRLIEIVKNK
jgi:hypothetical protein